MSDEKSFISVVCPACHQEIEVDASMAGQKVECPACGASVSALPPDQGPTAAQLEAMKSRTIRIELPDL